MPTMFSHPATALGLGAILGSGLVSGRLLAFAVLCAVVPDADVISFKLGIAYADILGHRGFSHSLLFAFLLGLLGFALAPWLRAGRLTAFAVAFLAGASHILLDALTDGGLGVAAFWPWSEQRYFFDWRPIEVSPISPRAFLSGRGLSVLLSELRWVWLPCLGLGAFFVAVRALRKGRKRSS